MRAPLLACLVLCGCSDDPLAEPCGPEGRTGDEVLQWIQTIYDVPLIYTDGGMTNMMISARYTGGAVTCHEAIPEVREYSYVDVEIDVQVLTTDGKLDEYFTGVARSTTFPWSEFAYSIPADELRGTFDIGMTDHTDRSLTISAQFQDGDLWGSVMRSARQPNGVPVTIPAARWTIGNPNDW
ncbi:MAG TPA: hypothetical protein VIV11_18630 [Kofleriaceae bacterium]